MIEPATRTLKIAQKLSHRNSVSQDFFAREAPRLADACREMAARFLRGGRLIAFGRGPYATDAQHVSVEFVHPVIVGKRALPALDLSAAFAEWVPAVVRADDIIMGFGPPSGDPDVDRTLEAAGAEGAFTFALPGTVGDYAVASPSEDPFIHQELIEVLYHTLWETVHVFFEHRERGHDVGASSFLYPYLERSEQDTDGIVAEVTDSIAAKAEEDKHLRKAAAEQSAETLAEAAEDINDRLQAGGKIICLGNGGSATDANDFAIDCASPPSRLAPVPAISLSMEPANVTAIANDVGVENVFLRQLIAHGNPEDVVVAFSTSGSSTNVVSALEEARKQGLLTVVFAGYDGGDIVRQELGDHAIIVRSDYIPRIQEIHASLYHVLREGLRPCLN